jgi:hypothetical protein
MASAPVSMAFTWGGGEHGGGGGRQYLKRQEERKSFMAQAWDHTAVMA